MSPIVSAFEMFGDSFTISSIRDIARMHGLQEVINSIQPIQFTLTQSRYSPSVSRRTSMSSFDSMTTTSTSLGNNRRSTPDRFNAFESTYSFGSVDNDDIQDSAYAYRGAFMFGMVITELFIANGRW